jgi:Esterase/lipase
MSKYAIHEDFKKLEKNTLPFYPIVLPLLNKLMQRSNSRLKLPDGIVVTKKQIKGYRNGLIDLFLYEPANLQENAPCLVYFHGGAFALKEAHYHIRLVCDYALRTPCKVVFVDYRLAPKHVFPVGAEDGYASFEWTLANADSLGIDPRKIAVGGDSAGGAIAAGVTLMARDKGVVPGICYQMLVYPVTDARQTTESMRQYTDTPMWNAKLNKKMWDLYLKNGVEGPREYASPMEAASLDGLPDAYLEVAEYDCLRDEGIQYAEALRRSGVGVELHRTEGTVHGYDLEEKSDITLESKSRRIEALRKAFYGHEK